MKGLDLDYPHYRSSFFSVKNDFDIYEDYLRRNKNIKSNIILYSKNFKDFLDRKSKRKSEKERVNFLKRTKFSDETSLKPFSDSTKHEKKKSIDFNIKRIKDISFRSEREESEKKEEKTFYRMKNIVLSASKIKISPIKK